MNAEHYQSAVLRRAGTKLREIHHHLQAGRVDLAKMRVGDLDREIRREAEELESMINAEMAGRDSERSADSLVDKVRLLEALLKEASDLLVGHHDSTLTTWFGHCPVCTKGHTESYPDNIFGRIEKALSVNAQEHRQSGAAPGASAGCNRSKVSSSKPETPPEARP